MSCWFCSSPENTLTLEWLTCAAILSTLEKLDGNRTATAQALGISVRTVSNKISEYEKRGIPVTPPKYNRRWATTAGLQPPDTPS